MRDVAKLANVSQSTVSRVLSLTPQPIPIGEETRQRVLHAVETLGYQPNLHAGSLRGQKTHMIAMLIADISNPFYHPMVRAVQDVAHAHRYDVLVANSDHARENELLFCNSIIRRPVDGIVIVPYHLTNYDLDHLLAQTGAAIAVLGQHITHPAVDVVCVDDWQASYDAVRWLIHQRQHEKVALISVTKQFPPGARRQAAYHQALTDAGLSVKPAYIQEGDWSVESGTVAMQALLALPDPPTAVFALNDHMAIGALLAVQAAGKRVPADVAIVGFDDIPAASWLSPKLTTIAQPAAAIGRQLAAALFERIDGSIGEERRVFDIPCAFIARASA
jgi:LacI family transcriptional regulator/LacI family repressor for deo operon, udp, cdd, tsx, nupC, and nupG